MSDMIFAQPKNVSADTSKLFELREIVIVRNAEKNDALANFYKANRSATTEEILSRAQSVQLIRRGNYGLEPSIRGCSAGQIAVTIDGMHITGACTDKMDPVTIYVEPQNLQSIDVTTGTNGAMYGSSIGGSLNMKLAEPELNVTNVSIGSGFQSAADAYNGTFSLNTGSDRFALLFNGVYRRSGNYRAGGGTEIPFSQYEKMNWSLATTFQISEADVVNADVLFDDGWNIGFPALAMDVGSARARIYSLSYRYSESESFFKKFEAKVYGNNITHAMDDTRRPFVPIHMEMPGWSDTYGSFAEAQITLHEAHTTLLRADVTRTNVRAEMTMMPQHSAPMFMLTLPDARRWSAGLFVNDEWLISNHYSLTTNLRAEYLNTLVTSLFGQQQLSVFGYNTSGTIKNIITNGTVNLTRQLSDETDATLTLGYGERASTMNELFGFYLYNRFDGFDYIGNPEIQNEQSLQTELALRYHTDAVQIKATGFFNRIKNYLMGKPDVMISAMTVGAKGVKVYRNIPYAVISGGELTAVFHPTEMVDLISSIKYLRGEDDHSISLPLISPLKIVTSTRYRMNGLTLQTEIEYSSEQNKIRTEVGEQSTPSYSLANVRASYAMPVSSVSLVLNCGMENIFDLRYRDHLDWGGIPRAGRNMYVSATISR